jgi:hypothetical protein
MMTLKDNTYSARSVLRSLGVSEIKATFALRQQIQLAPMYSDPDAGGTVIIIKAVQRGMNQIGCHVAETGRLDAETARCIRRASGPNWEAKTWLDIAKDVVLLKHSGYDLTGPIGQQDLGLGLGLGAVPTTSKLGGLALIAGVAFLAFKLKG